MPSFCGNLGTTSIHEWCKWFELTNTNWESTLLLTDTVKQQKSSAFPSEKFRS